MIWQEDGQLYVENVPTELIAAIRVNKAEILDLLDGIEERDCIQWEAELSPDSDPSGCSGVAGFEGLPAQTPAQSAQNRVRRAGSVNTVIPPSTVVAIPSMGRQSPLPHRCGDCSRFLRDQVGFGDGMGYCTASSSGLPPQGGQGYRVAYPRAAHWCPEFATIAEGPR
jgi:hypothetical protein